VPSPRGWGADSAPRRSGGDGTPPPQPFAGPAATPPLPRAVDFTALSAAGRQPQPLSMPTALAHRAGALLLALILTGFASSCSRIGDHGFHSVELSKEDIISLYKVPVDQQPAHKFVWKFPRPHCVRWVVERRDAPTAEWKLFQTWAFNQPSDQAFLLEQIDANSPDRLNKPEWNLHLFLRTGGSITQLNLKRSSTSDSGLALPMLSGTFETESHTDDPDRILLLTSGPRSYRLRMEASEKPFPPKN